MLLRRPALVLVALVTLLDACRGQDAVPEGAISFGSGNWRHGQRISNAEMSPDGRFLATAGRSSVRVWDLDTRRAVHAFPCDHGSMYSCPRFCFSPDGKRLGYVRGPEFACVWDLNDGRELLRISDKRSNPVCAFSPDGKQFLACDNAALHVFDLSTGRRVGTYKTGSFSLLSPDQKSFVRVDEKKAVVFGDVATGKETARWEASACHEGIRNGVAFSPDGMRLAVVHNDSEIQIREFVDGAVKQTFPVPIWAQHEVSGRTYFEYRVSFSNDGRELLFATVGGTVHRWNPATGKELPTLVRHQGSVTSVFRRSDGKTLVSTGADGVVRRWDAATGKELPGYDGYLGRTVSTLTRDGRFVAVGDAGGRLDLCDSQGKLLVKLRGDGPAITNVAFSPDGKALVAGLRDGSVRFWAMPSGKPGAVWATKPQPDWEFGVAMTLVFSPDGRFLCVSDYPYAMRLCEVASGRIVWKDKRDARTAFTPDGRTLAAVRGRTLTFLDAASGDERAVVQLNMGADVKTGSWRDTLVSGPDGVLAAALEDGHVLLCDGRTGMERSRFVAATPAPGPWNMPARMRQRCAETLAFSPDGQWLASGGTDSTVRIWEAASGRELWRRDVHDGDVSRVTFGPGGRSLLSSGEDSQVFLWNLKPKAKDARELDALWHTLASDDGPAVFRTIWTLSDRPDAGRFLRGKIAPASPPDAAKVKQWLAELSSPQFAVRDSAQKQLAELGELGYPELEKALPLAASAEARRRIERLLEARDRPPTLEQVRQARAVRALELAGTDEARATLREWAAGVAGARLTNAAAAALKRE